MDLKNRLLGLRKGRGLTQQEVADGSGLDLRAYQNYERGERMPRLEAVIALADFYEMTIDDLVRPDRKEP